MNAKHVLRTAMLAVTVATSLSLPAIAAVSTQEAARLKSDLPPLGAERAGNKLWHVAYTLPFIVPELPGGIVYPYVVHDLLRGGYAASSLFNERNNYLTVLSRRPEEEFSPTARIREGIG